jgi:hypothetical protein
VKGPIYSIKIISATYQGPFLKGYPHGLGIAQFKDGSFYEGEFSEGRA